MQVRLFLKLLNDYSGVLSDAGNSTVAQSLRDLERLFQGEENNTVAKVLGAIKKRRPKPQGEIEASSIQQAHRALTKLRQLLQSAAAKGPEKDVAVLIDLLEGVNCSSVSEFVLAAKSWIAKRESKPTKGGAIARADVVAAYLHDLRISESDNQVFDLVLSRLSKDKRVRVEEMKQIASQYLGFDLAKKKNKKDALQAIADRQALNARQNARTANQD